MSLQSMSSPEDKSNKKKPKFFDPDIRLKKKVGNTPFKKEKVNKADTFIEKNEVDFKPMAKEQLKKMRAILDKARKKPDNQKQIVEDLTQPVMELKANAATFKYPLISQMMNILLNFLETLEELNDDALDVAEVNYKTVKVILSHDMKGTSDKRGDLFVKELDSAIQRYRKKHSH